MRPPRNLRLTTLKRPPHPYRDSSRWSNHECLFIELPFSELIRHYRAMVQDADSELKAVRAHKRTAKVYADLRDKWQANNNNFYGGTTDTMLHYIDNGYQSGQFLGDFLPGVVRSREGTALRGRWVWDEHGADIDVDLALSGDPNCFRSFENRPTLGGLNIVALYSFSASTDFNVIAHFGSWIARLLGTCNQAGISPSLSIDQYGNQITTSSGFALIRTTVKHENDALDWRRYSCLFSPTGYRHLGFAAMSRAATQGNELLRGTLTSGLGYAVSPGNQWDMHWDAATRTITLWSPTSPSSFPELEMTDKLIATGALTPQEVYV